MAECSYARCLLERRLIKRELMKWSKDMLHIVGLERVAEELMGRRKWKHFQELHTRSHMSTENTTATITIENNLNLKEVENDRITLIDNNNKEKHSNLILLEAEPDQMQQMPNCEEENVKDQNKQPSQSESDKSQEEIKQIKEEVDENILTASGELSESNNNNQTLASREPTVENNNNKGELDSSNITASSAKLEHTKVVETPPSLDPIDWKPDDKCNFCIDGKLLTVNEKGELVAESGPAMSETEAQRLDTYSDSDESSNIAGGVGIAEADNRRLDLTKLLTSRPRDFSANMTSINSLTPQLATIQSLSGQYFQNLNWLQLAQQTSQQLNSTTPTTSEISAAALSPSLKDSPSPSDATGEQPLDLSSKPSPNSSTCGDLKAVRPKSTRTTTPISTGRRTYSDEDLNNALQDVLSGKSGTRKAAVRYSVPRSTLRNKMQALQNPVQQMEIDNSDDDGEGDADSSVSIQQTNDGQQQTFDEAFPATLLKKLTESNANLNAFDANAMTKNAAKAQNSTAPLLADALAQGTQPAALLQAIMLLASNFGGLDDRVSVRDLLSALLVNSGANLKAPPDSNDAATENSNLNNGRAANFIAQQLLLQQLQQQENQQQRTSPFTPRLATSYTPETNSSLDPNDDDQASILKIPSYKPVAGSTNAREPSISPTLVNNNNNNSTSSNLHRNGDSPQSAPSPRISTSLLAAAVSGSNLNSSCARQSNIPVVSPPLASHHSLGSADSQSPPSICFREMIANSIHRSMSDQANKEAQATTSNDYKKPSISVVKNIGGTDTSRFGSAPNVLSVVGGGSALHHNHQSQFHMQQHHSHHSSHHLSRQEAAALAAGKGTRPKRGKYRNYDRDSLVEAVKAVQRGEMSVHRAGSYYGVPHSTLEYKVKERHLMRPRKREPKPQPGLDGTASGSAASTSSKSNSNIPGLNSLDKLKAGGAVANASLKLNSALKNNNNSALPYPSASSNGMKLPLFDPAAIAQLQYPPQFFWQHGPTAAFSQLQIDLNRNAAAQGSVPHMQRFKDETMSGNANSPSPATSPMGIHNHHQFTPETLYESGGTNGSSFLDGIIRKTLDRKAVNELAQHASTNASNSTGSGALLDQLVKKTPLPFTNNRSNDYATSLAANAAFSTAYPTASLKRSNSPPAFPGIKRERTTPPLPAASSEDEESTRIGNINDATLVEHNNNNNNKTNPNGNSHTNHGSDSDSETVTNIRGENSSHNTHSNHRAKTEDVNGDSTMPKINPTTSPAPFMESNAVAVATPTTSILQEKLAQIKAEQEQGEVKL